MSHSDQSCLPVLTDGVSIHVLQGIGEPGIIAAITVFCAVKEAIMSARADAGHHGTFRLDSPATPERIRMACEDNFTKMVAIILNYATF